MHPALTSPSGTTMPLLAAAAAGTVIGPALLVLRYSVWLKVQLGDYNHINIQA